MDGGEERAALKEELLDVDKLGTMNGYAFHERLVVAVWFMCPMFMKQVQPGQRWEKPRKLSDGNPRRGPFDYQLCGHARETVVSIPRAAAEGSELGVAQDDTTEHDRDAHGAP